MADPVLTAPAAPPVAVPEAPVGRNAGPPGHRSRARTVAADTRVWWTVAGITVLLWAFQLFGYVDVYPAISLAVVVLGLWGLGTVVAVWVPRAVRPRTARLLAGATLALVVGAFLLWAYLQVIQTPAYGTDELAFDQFAAQLLQHGVNPYTHSMAPAFSLFHVSPNGYTFRLDGQPVTALSYPSLSFLVYLPFLLAGWSSQMAVGVNVIAWAVGIVVTFVLLPRTQRPAAIVIGSFSVYVAYAVGGVTDALFVPLLVGAAYRWDRFAWERGPAAWRGPVLLGLAMAVKQTPWLVLPFIVAGVALEGARIRGPGPGLRTGARYLGIAVATFLLPNLAFILWSPHAWLTGVLTPVASHTVPAGQGLVGLSLFLGVGGGSLGAYSVLLVVVLLSLLAAFVATYPALKAWALLCPALVLFTSARSFGSYLVTLLPAALVAATSVRLPAAEGEAAADGGTAAADGGTAAADGGAPGTPPRPWRRWPWVVGGGVVVSGAAAALVLLSGPPLAVSIESVRTSGQLATVVQLSVEVTNRSSSPATPSFTVESGGDLTAFWLTERGPATLAPGARARYTLLAPNFPAQPPITGGFQVVAFTSSPATVSRSAAYLPTTYHVSLDPDAVDRIVPVGVPVVLRASILDQLNRPVHLADQPVYLGQVIYGQQGLVFGQAVINQGQVGQTPVVAYTDGSGVATFTIRGTQAATDPVSFEANLVNARQFYPYGYSQIVPVRFGT